MVNKKIMSRCFMYYHFLKQSRLQAAVDDINNLLGNNSASTSAVHRWFARFRSGDITCEDEPRSGRPSVIVDDELITLVRNDPNRTLEDYADELEGSRESVRRALHRLGYVSMLQKWVPHDLTPEQKARRVSVCIQLLERQKNRPFLD